jgi:acetyl esterase/lipase
MALQDAQRTMGLIRFRAAEYHIDPHKIGVRGLSAGGHLVADISTRFDNRVYPAVDAAVKESCRPDFAVALYPGHLRTWFALHPEIRVTRQTPPTFLLQAENDDVDSVNNSPVYYTALMNVGVPVEMHLYAEGKHAFGLRRNAISHNTMARAGRDVVADDRVDFTVIPGIAVRPRPELGDRRWNQK